MDNKIFNANGSGTEMLELALKLACQTTYVKSIPIEGWKVNPKKGLVLYWSANTNKEINKFPTPLYYNEVVGMVEKWLKSPEAENIPCEGLDSDVDHDGHNELGWRVYTEAWGKVDGENYSICAIKPAYLWYGK